MLFFSFFFWFLSFFGYFFVSFHSTLSHTHTHSYSVVNVFAREAQLRVRSHTNVCLRYDREIVRGQNREVRLVCVRMFHRLISLIQMPNRSGSTMCSLRRYQCVGGLHFDRFLLLHADQSIRAHMCDHRLPLCGKSVSRVEILRPRQWNRANSTTNHFAMVNADRICCHTFLILLPTFTFARTHNVCGRSGECVCVCLRAAVTHSRSELVFVHVCCIASKQRFVYFSVGNFQIVLHYHYQLT